MSILKNKKSRFDLDKDGILSEQELENAEKISGIERANLEAASLARKQIAQRRMATAALVSMFIFTATLFMPFVSDSRLDKISGISDLFYISMASIVGAYMGMTAYMSRR